MHSIMTSDDAGCDVNLSYDEIVAIHELIERVIPFRVEKVEEK